MYNAEVKLNFIDNYTSSPSYALMCETVFNQTAPYEEQWGADLCTRSKAELQKMLDGIVGTRSGGGYTRLVILKNYVTWCKKQGVPNVSDGIFSVTVTTIESIKTKMIPNPLSLQQYLDNIFEPVEDETLTIIYRCYFWLAFSGLSEDEIFQVTAKNIVYEEGVIRLGDKTYPLYRESLPTISRAARLTSFNYYKDSESAEHKQHRRERVSGSDSIMRGLRSENDFKKTSQKLMYITKDAVDQNKTKIRLNYKNTMMSGYFYRQREKEISLQRPLARNDFSNAPTKAVSQHDRNKVIKEALFDYENWKDAFGL